MRFEIYRNYSPKEDGITSPPRRWQKLRFSSTQKNSLCQNKEFKSFHDEISPDGRARLLEICYWIARKCSPLAGMWQVWAPFSLSHSRSLALSLLRSAAPVQGTPAAGFWVCISLSLHRQQGTRSSSEESERRARQETLSCEPNPRWLEWREPIEIVWPK